MATKKEIQQAIKIKELTRQIRNIYKYAKVKPSNNLLDGSAWQALGSIQSCCEFAMTYIGEDINAKTDA